ncbi:tetratricopeptide repeat protein [Spirulina sp. CCNP1310]|uniref:tetratricopeptide repeat protein n=1 Tax=Spirulina sp. CCNP1310 TaxID=3110249 RepID=UPI002B1FD630|nr:tetratricopeptide repeat protein [Spirulina sp. CCNP1310]MEA5418579.1 tetratricopeptide repeat protein [Spirulina sp. CCNP1310]
MRKFSGFLGVLVWSGLVVGVGAVEGRAAVGFLGEAEGIAPQPQMLDLPQEWLVAQNSRERQPLVFEGELSAESDVLGDGRYVNLHTFTGRAGERIVIDLISDAFDAVLVLADREAKSLAQDDDGGENSNARIVMTLPADGQYVILVLSYQAGEVGRYRLTVQSAVVNGAAPNAPVSGAAAQAEQLFQEGMALYREGSLDSLRAAIAKWEAAIPLYRQVGNRDMETATLYNIGGVYSDLGEKSRALEYYNQALPLLRAVGNRRREAITLSNIGGVYSDLGEKSRALEYYNQALPLLRAVGDREGEATILSIVGLVYSDIGENSRALEYYNQALPLWRAVGDRDMEAATLNNIGRVYDDLGEKSRALEYYNQALPLRRAVGDRSGEANTLRNIGAVYSDLGENSRALEYYNQALPLFRALGDRRMEAITLGNIGGVYYLIGENSRALEYYNQALPLFRALGDRGGEGTILNNIGLVYSNRGEQSRALEYYNQALPLLRAVGNRGVEAKSLHNIGRVYSDLGERDLALEYYNQALPLSRAVGDREGEAIALTNVGYVHHLKGNTSLALEYYNEALLLSRAVGDRRGEAATLHAIGLVYNSLGENSRALEYYNQALPMRREVGDRGGEATTLNNIGGVYNSLGEKSRALEYFNQALPLYEAVGDIDGEANTLRNAAWVQRDEGQLTAALENIQAAIALIEQLRSNITSTELRQTYFAQQQGYYQFYTDLLMQLHQQNPNQGYDAQAFHVSERSRARTLIELLTESQLNLRDTTENAQLQPLLDQEQNILNQLTAQQQLLTQRLTNAQTDEQRDQIRQDYTTATQQLNSELDRLVTQIKRLNPAYTDLKYPDPLNLQQVQQQVLDDDTVLLQYSLHPDQSYLWLITKNGYETHILPPQAQIETTVERLTNIIRKDTGNCANAANPQACIQQNLPETLAMIQTTGTELYNQIFAPIANKIQGKRLLIIPDGALHYVPFAALPIPPAAPTPLARGLDSTPPFLRGAGGDQYTPLVTQHEIIHAPSATAIATQRQNLANRPPAPKKLAIFADPVFSANDPRVTGATPTPTPRNNEPVSLQALRSRSALDRSLCLPNDGIQRLPGTRREAEALQKYVPDALTVLDFAANQDWFDRAPLHQYQTLFLSTHGCIDSQNPELSGLVLSLVDENGQEKEDGFLRLNEIFGLNLNAELVVLSACQTGLGETIKGEGMIGMTRGFMYAGAKRVVVSLWNVDDAATAELMSQFYGDLEKGISPAQALREAQLALWEKYQDPRLWAAFTLQGD